MSKTKKWPRYKVASFRRWKARFLLGKSIPATAILECPRVRKLSGSDDADYCVNVDSFRLKRPA